MRKEVLLAIIAGVSLGFIFAFSIWRMALKFKTNDNKIAHKQATPPSASGPFVKIENLNDYSVINRSPYKIRGSAEPNSKVIISTVSDDFFGETNESGQFEIEIEPPSSLFRIKLVTIENNQAIINQGLNLVYHNNDDKKIAYVGTVTDITSESIQIKSTAGEIQQGAIANETKYQNQLLNKPQDIKLPDIAIGDFAILIGTINGNKILKIENVLITKSPQDVDIEIITGKLLSKTKSQLTIETLNKEEKISLPQKWKGPDLTEIKNGQDLILTGTIVADKFNLRSIFPY